MPWHYYLSVTLHVLAAMAWLGGMLFLGLVGAPVLRAVEPAAVRQRLFRDIGLRFRGVGWWAIVVLVVTGTANLWYRGWIHGMGSADFWRTATGIALAVKLASVLAMLVLQAFHDFVAGPRASQLTPGLPEADEARRRAAVFARVSALLGIVVVIAAVRLARS